MATQQVRATVPFDTNKDTRKQMDYNKNAIISTALGSSYVFPYLMSKYSNSVRHKWQETCFPGEALDDYSNYDLTNLVTTIKNALMIPKHTQGSFGSGKFYFCYVPYPNDYSWPEKRVNYNGTNTIPEQSTVTFNGGNPVGKTYDFMNNDSNTYVALVKIDAITELPSTITSESSSNFLSNGAVSTQGITMSTERRNYINNLLASGEYVITRSSWGNNVSFYTGTDTTRTENKNVYPCFVVEYDGYYVAEVDGDGNYTNRLVEQSGIMYQSFSPYALIDTRTRTNSPGLTYLATPGFEMFSTFSEFFKQDDIFFSGVRVIIKKASLIRYLNYVGIPWTFDATAAASTPVSQLSDGYDPNQHYYDPENPPGQPDNESGGGDGLGDNSQDNFDLPTPAINPAKAAVNQYVLNSNQVYSFMEELFNGTFWTNSDLLNKNPKESVVSLTAWPLNLLNWDLDHVGLSQPIQCGNVTMQYASGQPIQNGYNKVIDIGEYEIRPYFGSFMDYLTKIEIFLPFIGWRNLSTQNVMGRKIKVKYVLNFEDGGIVVYITSTDGKIERLEQVEQAKLAFDLPIFTSNINEKEKDKLQLLMTAAISAVTAGVGAFGSGAGGVASAAGTAAGREVVSGASKIAAWQDHINGGSVVASNATWYLPNKCILKFTRPRKSEPSGYGRVNGYPANYTAKLGDVTGYTEVDQPLINNIECTENERAQIKALLQGGIYL